VENDGVGKGGGGVSKNEGFVGVVQHNKAI
jgi:hypothetical protein